MRASTKQRLFLRCQNILFQVFLEVAAIKLILLPRQVFGCNCTRCTGIWTLSKLYNLQAFYTVQSRGRKHVIYCKRCKSQQGQREIRQVPLTFLSEPRRTQCRGLRLAWMVRQDTGHLRVTQEPVRARGEAATSPPSSLIFSALLFVCLFVF